MPWYAFLYLALLYLLTAATLYVDYKEKEPAIFHFFNLLSAGIVTLFIYGFFDATLALKIGTAAIPLFVTGIGWEIFSEYYDLRAAQKKPDNDENINTIARLVLITFTLIGYLPGLKIFWDALQRSA